MATYPCTVGEISPATMEEGAPVTDADITLLSNWGTGATFAVAAGSTSSRGRLTISGGDLPIDATPSWQLLFPIPFSTAPMGMVLREDSTRQPSTSFNTLGIVTTQGGTIAAFTTHIYDWMIAA